MRFRYSPARWAVVHLVCIFIAIRSPCPGEHLAGGLNCPDLSGPPVKQRWIVPELQQRSCNSLRFRHDVVWKTKACFLVFTFGIAHVSLPSDVPIAHIESSRTDV